MADESADRPIPENTIKVRDVTGDPAYARPEVPCQCTFRGGRRIENGNCRAEH